MAKQYFEIESVFSKWLGAKARELAETMPGVRIIPTSDFPEGIPIHEDGSTEYDPMKPMVLFAIQLSNKRAIDAWAKVCHEFDAMRLEHV